MAAHTPHEPGRPRGKLGAKQHPFDPGEFRFGSFVKLGSELKVAPVGYEHDQWRAADSWGMLGNDQVGDCVCAGAGHETMIWAHSGSGTTVQVTTENAVAMYHDVTGWNPGPDEGTDPVVAARWRHKTGLEDAAGNRHKIGAYVLLEAGNWTEALQALYMFESIAFCFDVPESAMKQFDAGHRWSYVRDTNIVGGHYVNWGARPGLSVGECITWGQRQQFTRSFFKHYNTLGLAYVSAEMLNGQGKSPEGFDLVALNEALRSL